MTIKELAVQYRHSIQIIKDRRAELRRAIKASEDPAEIEELQIRHRDLLLIERDIVVVDVYYSRLIDSFGYKFVFFKHQGVTLEMATAITDEIVSKLVHQSYDHGAQWRECGVRSIIDEEFELSITVFFRVRDAG